MLPWVWMSRLEIPSGMTWSLAKRKHRKWKSGFPKITFPADKESGPGLGVGRAELEVVCKWERGLKSAKHIHAHIANHRWKNLKFYISFLIFYCLLSRKLLWPKPNLTLLNSLASRCSRMSGGALISSASFCCQMNGWILFCHFKFPSEIAPLTPHSAQVAFRHHWRVL